MTRSLAAMASVGPRSRSGAAIGPAARPTFLLRCRAGSDGLVARTAVVRRRGANEEPRSRGRAEAGLALALTAVQVRPGRGETHHAQNPQAHCLHLARPALRHPG